MGKFMSIRQAAKSGILNEGLLRKLVAQGKAPGFYSGRKFMIDIDRLEELLHEMSEGQEII